MTFAFVKGDEVVLRARPGTATGVVTDVLVTGSEPQYKVRFGEIAQVYSARHLELADAGSGSAVDPIELLRAGALADSESFRAFMTLAKLEKPLSDNLYSFAASRTERLPHQFKAVLKLLSNPYGRLLIADEVGLGKTIEAGIILTELNARGPLDHVLVACPSPLTQKWRREMRDRFLFDFEVVDGQGFRDFVLADRERPNAEPRRIIASLELMRRAENIEALGTAAPNLDVVVVDEAHHMRNVGTATNDLGEVLAGLAETVIFLTATPLNLGRDDFFQLMRLLVPEEFPHRETFIALIEPNAHINLALRHLRAIWPPSFADALEALTGVENTAVAGRFTRSPRYLGTRGVLEGGARGQEVDRAEVVRCQRNLIELNTLSHVFTRTRKREVQELFPTRRSATVAVTFAEEERAFYDAVTDWVFETYADRAAHLVAATFQRLAASCLPALGRRLTDVIRTRTFSIGADEAAELSDDNLLHADRLDEAFSGHEVELEVEPSAVEQLLSTWEAYGGRIDTKYDGFREALLSSFAAGADRILVFSYFKGTIDYLADRLSGLPTSSGEPLRVLKLYGPLSSTQRDEAVASFRDDAGPVVLLSSEVGSEGLDFQYCSRMFNYDLPWNPMRVEQRIGRLDRYGQASKVIHILNMIVSDTIEERIFHRLYERIKIFESSIGDLEAILGEVEFDLASLQRDALSGNLTDAELERRRNLIADVIIRRQQDDDAFEQESKQFLSNDDVFLELFNDIERSRRYVTPDQLRLLVERYLRVCGCRVTLKPVGQTGVFQLTGAIDRFRPLLARRLANSGGGAKAARAFLGRLDDAGIDVTFDPAIATAQRRLEFISLHHPLVRALASSEDLRAELSCCAALAVDLDVRLNGMNGFFVYELQAHGIKDQLELATVIVSGDGEVVEGGSTLLTALDKARDVAIASPPEAETVDRMQGAALDWVTEEVATREQELQSRSDETVTAQIESLSVSADRRRLWLQEQIQEGRSTPIVRMRRAQLSRLESDVAAKMAQLQERRGVSVGYRLIAAGMLASAE